MIQVNYSNMMKYKDDVGNVVINTFQPKGKSVIDLDYNNITFNEALSFPYSVPNGYNRIIIK
jgi:predicted 3-demethylubiquinone-9 3-methyltransferase (glyoxalase superfamily)